MPEVLAAMAWGVSPSVPPARIVQPLLTEVPLSMYLATYTSLLPAEFRVVPCKVMSLEKSPAIYTVLPTTAIPHVESTVLGGFG